MNFPFTNQNNSNHINFSNDYYHSQFRNISYPENYQYKNFYSENKPLNDHRFPLSHQLPFQTQMIHYDNNYQAPSHNIPPNPNCKDYFNFSYSNNYSNLNKREYPFHYFPQPQYSFIPPNNSYYQTKDNYFKRKQPSAPHETIYKLTKINNYQMNFKIYQQNLDSKNEKLTKENNDNVKEEDENEDKRDIYKNNEQDESNKKINENEEIENEKKMDLVFNNWNYLSNKTQKNKLLLKNKIINCFNDKFAKEKIKSHQIGIKINFGFTNIEDEFKLLSVLNKIQLFIYFFNKLVSSDQIIKNFTGFKNFTKEIFPVKKDIPSICE